jgi:4-hydroxybenzoate polyprenyltransferase
MLALQVSIGALNDAADAPFDVAGKPGKPIPAGMASQREAVAISTVGFLVGIGLSAPSGVGVAAVALLGAGLGYAYDLWLSRTVASWLPLALALPLSPIHAWLGATGDVPPGLVTLLPVAVAAGLLLTLSNGLVDVERDRASGKGGLARRLGEGRAWLANALAVAGVAVLAVLLIPSIPLGGSPDLPGDGGAGFATVQVGGLLGGLGALALGALVLRSRSPRIRERGWELQAVGVAGIGVAWMAGLAVGALP